MEAIGKEMDKSYVSYVGLLAEPLALETRGDLEGARVLYARVVQLPRGPEGVRAKASARLAGLP